MNRAMCIYSLESWDVQGSYNAITVYMATINHPGAGHQQKIFYLMYYILIFLYPLVIPSLSTPPLPFTSPSFSQISGGLQEAQNILLESSISCFSLGPLAQSSGEWVLQHRPQCFCGSYPLAMLASVQLIWACVHSEKPTPVWYACTI